MAEFGEWLFSFFEEQGKSKCKQIPKDKNPNSKGLRDARLEPCPMGIPWKGFMGL